jgi:DnaJ-class molecular chaperone
MNYHDGEQDPYVILGVRPDADGGEIKAAYRQKSLLMHPDRDRSRGASERFAALTEAYHTCLSNFTAQGPKEEEELEEQAATQTPPSAKRVVRRSIDNLIWLTAEEFNASRYRPIEKTIQLDLGSFGLQNPACDLCKGKGSYWKKAAVWHEVTCNRCQQLKPQITIKIPRSVKDGTKLRVDGDSFGVDLDVIVVVRHVFSDL